MKSSLVMLVFSVNSWFLTESFQCIHPPRLWCTSKQISSACQVERQCEASISNDLGASAPRVKFEVYYETLCPDSIDLIIGQLTPTYFKIGNIMNLELVPYGNARQKQVGDNWEFTCQHGPMECLGNIIQTCAIHNIGNMTEIYPFVDCMERSGKTPDISGPKCAKVLGVDYQAILKCVNSSFGNKLEHDMGVKTEKLDPPHTFVPWVVLNGVHTDEIQQEAQTDLLKLICDTYKGKKPDACRKESAVHKCLNNLASENLK